MRAVLVDTQGPEIRTGNIEDGGKIALMQGSTIELTTNPVRPGDGTRYFGRWRCVAWTPLLSPLRFLVGCMLPSSRSLRRVERTFTFSVCRGVFRDLNAFNMKRIEPPTFVAASLFSSILRSKKGYRREWNVQDVAGRCVVLGRREGG